MSDDNEDLQEFLDNFQKEIEEGNSTAVTLTSRNVTSLADGDKVVEKILLDNSDEDDGDGGTDEDVTYYLDDDGNCYKEGKTKKSLPKKTQVQTRFKRGRPAGTGGKAKQSKITAGIFKRIKSEDVVNVTNNEEGTQDEDVVVIEGVDESHNNISKIYNFDENNDDVDDNKAGDDYEVETEVIRLKPASQFYCTTYNCETCDYKTTRKFLLQRHEKSHSNEKPFTCSVCERGFKTNAALVNHVNVHLGKRPHACKDCDSAFTTSGELLRHVRYKHTGEKPHKCTECGYASVEMSKLRRHIRCHTGERPYQCPHCTYASPDTFKLKRHLRTHTGEKPYACDICQARFTQSNSLKSHRLIHSVVDKPVFQCTLCPTTCGRKADLRMHILNLHHSDKPIPCKRCGMELPDRYSYKLHIKSHDGEKCYRCKICPYASISQRHLDSHMLVHTGEKPFKCEYCDLEFRQRQLLTRHINVYHNKTYMPPQPREKVHDCPHCKRTFTHKGNLMRHMEVHDPASQVIEKKLDLKKGRNIRISSNVEEDMLSDGYNDIELYDEDDELGVIEFTEEEPKNSKDTRSFKIENKKNYKQSNEKDGAKDVVTFRIKQEQPDDELITVHIEGEEQYMVLEVVNEAEDDEELEENSQIASTQTNVKSSTSKNSYSNINSDNCFGFETDDKDVRYNEDDDFTEVESKEFIQLMDIINEDKILH